MRTDFSLDMDVRGRVCCFLVRVRCALIMLDPCGVSLQVRDNSDGGGSELSAILLAPNIVLNA